MNRNTKSKSFQYQIFYKNNILQIIIKYKRLLNSLIPYFLIIILLLWIDVGITKINKNVNFTEFHYEIYNL